MMLFVAQTIAALSMLDSTNRSHSFGNFCPDVVPFLYVHSIFFATHFRHQLRLNFIRSSSSGLRTPTTALNTDATTKLFTTVDALRSPFNELRISSTISVASPSGDFLPLSLGLDSTASPFHRAITSAFSFFFPVPLPSSNQQRSVE